MLTPLQQQLFDTHGWSLMSRYTQGVYSVEIQKRCDGYTSFTRAEHARFEVALDNALTDALADRFWSLD